MSPHEPMDERRSTVIFDVQQLLENIHKENREALMLLAVEVRNGFKDLRETAEEVAKDLATHDKNDTKIQATLEQRIQAIETIAANQKWLIRTTVAATIVFIADLILRHVK